MTNAKSILGAIEDELARLAPGLIETRRHLHRHPELSGTEFSTTAYLSERLTSAGIAHRIGRENRGLITEPVLGNAAGTPLIALRADIDALPIQEANPVEYRSREPGVMHACGHDAHTAILLALTLALYRGGALPLGWRAIFNRLRKSVKGPRK